MSITKYHSTMQNSFGAYVLPALRHSLGHAGNPKFLNTMYCYLVLPSRSRVSLMTSSATFFGQGM